MLEASWADPEYSWEAEPPVELGGGGDGGGGATPPPA